MTYAGHTLSALRRFHPRSRYRLPLARQYFTNWKSVLPTKQAVPMPAMVVMALAGAAIRVHEYRFAATILVGFAAFLRTGEMTALSKENISIDTPSGHIILALPATKTSKQSLESVEVYDVNLAHLLSFALHEAGVHPLAGCSPNQFRAKLRLFCDFFNLQGCNFTAYSLRRGGASHAFSQGTTLDQLLLRGRWQSIKTARIYLDSGRASLVQMRFSACEESHMDQFATYLTNFCGQLRQKRSK